MRPAQEMQLDAPLAPSAPPAWTCPRCKCPALFRSRLRSRRESLLAAATPLRPYCCHECMHRSWRAWPPGATVRETTSRILGAARDAASGGAAAARDRIARAARQGRLHRPAAWRAAGLTVAVLAIVGLLVIAARWFERRLELRGAEATNATASKALPPATAQLRPSPKPATSAAAAKRSGSRARGAASRASGGATSSRRPGGAVAEPGAPRTREAAFSWDHVRWGMTLRDAAATLPASALPVRRGRAGAHAVARTTTRLGSRAYVADLRFDRVAGLDEIQLTPSAELDDVDAAFEDAVAALTARYGAPTERRDEMSPARSATHTAAWVAPGTRVSVSAWKTAMREAKVLRFDVKSGAVTPSPTGLEVTLVPAASR